jgi:glutathione peroxidase-family protein
VTQHTDQRGGRAILLLIAGLPVTMILAATWLWYFVERGDIDIVGALGTANSGEILSNPVNIRSRSFTASDGSEMSLDTLEPKWTFMVVNSGETCDATCSELLYLTRQIRIAIGRDFHRIQRVMMVDVPADTIRIQASTDTEGVQERIEGGAVIEAIDSASTIAAAGETPLLEAIESEHPDVSVWQAGAEPVVPERHVTDSAWYLVDPSGWVMMRYASEVNYKDVIGDLKFLLKNSGG